LTGKVLILGGYGNFGKRIARALAASGTPVVIAGRDPGRAKAGAAELPAGLAEAMAFDVRRDLRQRLSAIRPIVVVNTCGPFQNSDYSVAEACIDAGTHYIDLADGRDFVTGITALDARARDQGVAVISGASTVPALSSAVIEHLRPQFSELHALRFGISPGQKAERGLATTQGILSYVGKPLRAFVGDEAPSYGWQHVHRQHFPVLGKRWMANCDIPDLDLLPEKYGLRSIRFSAGLELVPLHIGLWALSWLVRIGLPLDLPRHAKGLLTASNFFDRFGSADGGMFVILKGLDINGRSLERRWFIIAKDGEGPQIPTIPAIILARKAARGELTFRGATACTGLVMLDEYLAELSPYPIETFGD
jgi:saccharopine dehydrogenase-like NADP-dependent oxidoreductase